MLAKPHNPMLFDWEYAAQRDLPSKWPIWFLSVVSVRILQSRDHHCMSCCQYHTDATDQRRLDYFNTLFSNPTVFEYITVHLWSSRIARWLNYRWPISSRNRISSDLPGRDHHHHRRGLAQSTHKWVTSELHNGDGIWPFRSFALSFPGAKSP